MPKSGNPAKAASQAKAKAGARAAAKDAHWQSSLERLLNRQPMRRCVTFLDDVTADALKHAVQDTQDARRTARRRLARELDAAEQGREPDADEVENADEVQEALAVENAAREAHEQASTDFYVVGLHADDFEELLGLHPPSDEDLEAGRNYHLKRIAPLLVSACSENPLSVEDAAALVGGEIAVRDKDGNETGEWKRVRPVLTQGEAAILFQTCIQVCSGARVTLGKG